MTAKITGILQLSASMFCVCISGNLLATRELFVSGFIAGGGSNLARKSICVYDVGVASKNCVTSGSYFPGQLFDVSCV